MKVLKYGDDVKSWRYKITCSFCKSELEVEAIDLRYSGEAGDWHDAGWERYECYCAACNDTLSIPANNIPPLVKVFAQNKKKGK